MQEYPTGRFVHALCFIKRRAALKTYAIYKIDYCEVPIMTKNSRKLKHLLMLPLCALFFFIGAVTVQAATYYVATTGNDARTCATAQTITTPKRTIASGVACLNPGDTLYIRAGTWTEQIDLQRSEQNRLGWQLYHHRGYPGETVTLTVG